MEDTSAALVSPGWRERLRLVSRRTKVAGLAAAACIAIAVGLAARAWSSAHAVPAVSEPASRRSAGISLPESVLAKNPIATTKVKRVRLAADLQVVGSVAADDNRVALVGPLVAGRVVQLRAGVGAVVESGQVLAEIESADVGQAHAEYLSASARLRAAEANLRRERDLAELRISSQRERELAEAQALTVRAEVQAAAERLHAFGLTDHDLRRFRQGKMSAGRVPLRTPIAGAVVARTVTLGQAVERATDAFKVVNFTKLWVLLDIYEKDLARVFVGQRARLRTASLPDQVLEARVAYVSPIVDEKTRTATVRIEFDNASEKLHPGQFVTARLVGDLEHAAVDALVVPRPAVASIEGKRRVFIRTPDGFEQRAVEVGGSSGDLVEVRAGVREGEEVVSDGAFLLKSELLR